MSLPLMSHAFHLYFFLFFTSFILSLSPIFSSLFLTSSLVNLTNMTKHIYFSRKSMNDPPGKYVLGETPSTPSHAPNESSSAQHASLLPSEILNIANSIDDTANFLKSYSSLRVTNGSNIREGFSDSNNVLPSSTSCQRRLKGDKNQSRSESMNNFSKRFSILTGKELIFPGNSSSQESNNVYNENCPPPIPEHQTSHQDSSFIRIQEKGTPRPHASTPIHQGHRMLPPPLPPHAVDLRPSSRLSSPDVLMFMSNNCHQQTPGSPHVRMRQSVPPPLPPHHPRIAPPCSQSSLVSLDRRIIPQRLSSSPSGGVHPNVHSSSSNDSVRRSALLRSASSTAAAVAAAASSSQHGHLHSTLGPNQFLHSSPSQLINQPVPRSLQVSPALAQRSMYAEHIFSQPEASPLFCTTSRLAASGRISGTAGDHTPRRSALGWVREELLKHHASRAASSSNASNSVLKSATSEFSFCRPDSPLTLPYNKSKSFYGRPISSGGPGVLSSNPSLNQEAAPPRPPLPKQVSLDSAPTESSTLFRCSAAATAAKQAGSKKHNSGVGCTTTSSVTSGPFSTASSSSSGFSSSSSNNTVHSSSLQRLQRDHSASLFSRPHQQHAQQAFFHQPSLPESLSSDSESQCSISSMSVTHSTQNNYNNDHHTPSLHSLQKQAQHQSFQAAQHMQFQPQNRPSSYHYGSEDTRGRSSSLHSDFEGASASLASTITEDDDSTLSRTEDRSRKNRMNRILEKSNIQ